MENYTRLIVLLLILLTGLAALYFIDFNSFILSALDDEDRPVRLWRRFYLSSSNAS